MPFFQNHSRTDLRLVYLEAWRKHRMNIPMEPLEAQVAEIIGEHPEYQALLSDSDATIAHEYTPENGQTNPFLHMGLHLAVRDQVATDRPTGIRAAYEILLRRHTRLEAEHAVIEPLAEMIWQSQRSGLPPDEQVYLRRVQKLAR